MQISTAVFLDQFCLINICYNISANNTWGWCVLVPWVLRKAAVILEQCVSTGSCGWALAFFVYFPHIYSNYMSLLTSLPFSPFAALDWLTLRYVFHKSIDPVSFWDQMAWQVINLSLHLSSSERTRKIQRGKKRRRRKKAKERGSGLNLTGPSSPELVLEMVWSQKVEVLDI